MGILVELYDAAVEYDRLLVENKRLREAIDMTIRDLKKFPADAEVSADIISELEYILSTVEQSKDHTP